MNIFRRGPKGGKGRFIGLFVSDTHGGHQGALMNPETKLFRKEHGEVKQYQPEMTDMQLELWDLFETHRSEVVKIADGCPILVTLNGDPTQGAKYESEVVSPVMGNQILIAIGNTAPLLMMPNVTHFRMASSTGAHVYGFASADLLLMTYLQQQFPAVNMRAVYQGLMTVNGVSIDYAHHGPHPGIREWTQGNVARFYLRDLMLQDIGHGKTPPKLVVRSHYHTYVPVWNYQLGYESWLIITPSYQFPGDWTTQATKSNPYADIGMVAVEFIDGRVRDRFPLMVTKDLRTREEITL